MRSTRAVATSIHAVSAGFRAGIERESWQPRGGSTRCTEARVGAEFLKRNTLRSLSGGSPSRTTLRFSLRCDARCLRRAPSFAGSLLRRSALGDPPDRYADSARGTLLSG